MSYVLSDEMISRVKTFCDGDEYFRNHADAFAAGDLEKLRSITKAPRNEPVLMYNGGRFIAYTGMVVTSSGFYYRGTMELPKHTTWEEFLSSPINIYSVNGTPMCLRVKRGLIGYKPFAEIIGNPDECADFWIRVKHVIAG